MATKIGINGFGRIGRSVVRAIHQYNIKDIDVVAVNDLTDVKMLTHLFKYDSVHRAFQGKVEAGENTITVGDDQLKVMAERDPAKLPWKDLGVDVVLECTGLFRTGEKAGLHLQGGAKKVILSAPGKGIDNTIVIGVNEDKYNPEKDHIVSCGSCTTNCLAPPSKVILDNFGIKRGIMTTIHSYTNDQALLDVPHRKGDLRRARAAAVSMVPTSTGAAKAISLVIPELEGKLDGMAVRVPTPDVSVVDLTVELEKDASADQINAALKKAADEGPLSKVLDYTDVPLVSSDYIGCPASSTVDGQLTKVMGGNLAKIFAWYDNEWGFSCRMVDLLRMVSKGL